MKFVALTNRKECTLMCIYTFIINFVVTVLTDKQLLKVKKFRRNYRCDSTTQKMSCLARSMEAKMICKPVVNPEHTLVPVENSHFPYILVISFVGILLLEFSFSNTKSSFRFRMSSKVTLFIAITVYAIVLIILCLCNTFKKLIW